VVWFKVTQKNIDHLKIIKNTDKLTLLRFIQKQRLKLKRLYKKSETWDYLQALYMDGEKSSCCKKENYNTVKSYTLNILSLLQSCLCFYFRKQIVLFKSGIISAEEQKQGDGPEIRHIFQTRTVRIVKSEALNPSYL